MNITLPGELEWALARSAKRDSVPQASKAANLLRLALEIEEDMGWDALARARDTKEAKFVSHEQAWQ